MRLATMIISMFAMLLAGIHSCAVAAGGSIVSGLSESEAERRSGENIAAAGGVGILAALVMLVAAAFLIARPRWSMIMFGVSAAIWVIAGALGFTDAFLWGAGTAVLAVLSYFGIRERETEEAQRAALIAATPRQPPGWYPDQTGWVRYWDGTRWTSHTRSQIGTATPGASPRIGPTALPPGAPPTPAPPTQPQAPPPPPDDRPPPPPPG